MYQPYATKEYYIECGYDVVPTEDMDRMLTEASRNIDTLTFNRIVSIGFDKLTEFQQQIIKDVVCKQASFLYENANVLSSILDKYTINSVSMEFGNGVNVEVADGVPILRSVYSLLEQTGLCWRGAI